MTLDRESLVQKRVTVLGLGIEGVDLVRYLASHGADVTVSDAKTTEQLSGRIRELEGLPVRFSLGAHNSDDITNADVIFVSQGVPQSLPALVDARERGIPVSSMTRLFMELCPGPTVGITGSSGKTTTTALVAAMFAEAGRRHVVGGNIGVGLLGLLDKITSDTWVILELSHTQLETVDRSPHVACVLNVTPNHLDRYTWDQYSALKLRILQFQTRDDICVLGLDDEVACSFATESPGRVVWFSSRRVPQGDGACLREGWVVWRKGTVESKLLPVDAIPLRGAHNVSNVLAAVAVAGAVGLDFAAIERAVRNFAPVPHRLELVRTVDGVSYYNDSIATTPERTLAGLAAFEEPIVLLLGGREKNLPLDVLAKTAIERCRAVICFGEAAPLLEAALGAAARAVLPSGQPRAIERRGTLEEAVTVARASAQPGDVVLLSPACTSFDAYANFEERGEAFRRIVNSFGNSQGGTQPSPLRTRAG
jgi:UDP-N-acetylmuramoylalanine--D-glutamate ligase